MVETYDEQSAEAWLNGLREMDEPNVRHLLAIFARLGIPESFLDVGCGTGAMVKTALKLGVRAYGIDQVIDESDKSTWPEGFYHMNLVDYWLAPQPVDIVLSIETAEHIHETAHGTLCRTLCDNLKPGPGHFLIFTAARPGQLGWHHVNARPAEYWHHEMAEHALHYDREMSMNLALIFASIYSPLNYFWDNLMVYQK